MEFCFEAKNTHSEEWQSKEREMKKYPIILILFALSLVACGNKELAKNNEKSFGNTKFTSTAGDCCYLHKPNGTLFCDQSIASKDICIQLCQDAGSISKVCDWFDSSNSSTFWGIKVGKASKIDLSKAR